MVRPLSCSTVTRHASRQAVHELAALQSGTSAKHASLLLQVQEDVRPHCFYNEDTNYFGLPTAEQLAGFNIVVCTCGAAGNTLGPISDSGHLGPKPNNNSITTQ